MPAQTVVTPARTVGRYQLDTEGCHLQPAERAARGKAARARVPRDAVKSGRITAEPGV